MHNKIYQIGRERINGDDFITECDFMPENYSHFADWIQDVDNDEYEELYKRLDHQFEGVFTRDGDELTYIGAEKFMEKWLAHIKAFVEPLTVESMKDWYPMFKVEDIIKNTHLCTPTKIYVDEEIQDLGDFMRSVFAEAKPGDKLYLGGIIDYHW